MKVRAAQKLRDMLLLSGFVIMLMAYFWEPLFILGVAIALSCIVPDFLYNKCPQCGKRLGRNASLFCQHCGEKVDDRTDG